ncbi:MAG: outer membrane lipoprotein-sorting protein [Thiotrichaceae bacterium]|nr:outer membrane lipoprotein-sorting protein [Thiotrichaceae bacterium]
MNQRAIVQVIATTVLALFYPFVIAAEAPGRVTQALSGAEIVEHCYYKNGGEDQRSRLLVTNTLTNGRKVFSEYIRLWKSYGGQDGIVDKVVLYTASAHNKGLAFMRWGYTNGSDRLADQWVYLPEMRIVKRISKRSPEEMDWGFSDDDLRVRDIDEDEYRFVEERTVEGKAFYIVESIPKHDPVYGKRISWFSKGKDWEHCLESRVDYFDKEMKMVKKQLITWRKIKGAWVWETGIVKNFRTDSTIVYDARDIEVNVGLKGREFSTRALARGYRR